MNHINRHSLMVCSSMPFALILSATSCLVSLRSRKEKMMLKCVRYTFKQRNRIYDEEGGVFCLTTTPSLMPSIQVKEKKIKANAMLYQLTDLFTLFHYTFAQKKTTDEHYWSNMLGTGKMNSWLGLAFERVCMLHIPQIKTALGIDRIHTEYYSWRSKYSQPAA